MTNSDDIQKFIRKYIQHGRSPFEIFMNAADQFYNDKSASLETSRRYFTTLKLGEQNLQKQLSLPPNLVQLLVQIKNEFEEATSGIEAQTCLAQKCKIQMLSERYAVDGDMKEMHFCGLMLFDLWHGQKRHLKTSLPFSQQLLLSHQYELAAIDADYLLFIDKTRQHIDHTFTIHLLKVDYSGLEAVLLDSKVFGGFFIRCANDRQRFLILESKNDSAGNAHLLRMEDSKLKLEMTGTLDLEGRDIFVGFKDTNLYELIYREQVDPPCFVFKKTNISDPRNPEGYLLEHDENVQFQDLFNSKYIWTGQVGYALKHFGNTPDTALYKIDLDVQKISTVSCLNVDQVMGISLNEDGILSVLSLNKFTGGHACRRFALGRPDKLLNLSLSAIHRHSMFLKEDGRGALVAKLPTDLKPFVERH